MKPGLAAAVLRQQADRLTKRCRKLVGRGGSAELTTRMRMNAERLHLLAARVASTVQPNSGPIICPERLIVFGEWTCARWKPWPWALAYVTIAQLVAIGAVEGDEARIVWDAYNRHSLRRSSNQTKR